MKIFRLVTPVLFVAVLTTVFSLLGAPVPVNQLPTTWATVTDPTKVTFAFRQTFWNRFWQDSAALSNYTALSPVSLSGMSQIDPDPNVAVKKLGDFFGFLRSNPSGMYDTVTERHDNSLTKVGQAFVQKHGNAAGAADYTVQVQGVSRYIANTESQQASWPISPLPYFQAKWCDVDYPVAAAAVIRSNAEITAYNAAHPQTPLAPVPTCPVPPTPTPTATPTPGGAPSPTATPTQTPTVPVGPTPTPTPIPLGGYTVTISCAPPAVCDPVVIQVPVSSINVSIHPN